MMRTQLSLKGGPIGLSNRSLRMLRIIGSAAACCLALASSTLAVDFNQSTGNLHYDDGFGNTLPYRLFLPAGYDTNAQYPVVIFLHGAGERGTDNVAPSTGGGHMENLYQAAQGTFGAHYKALLLVSQCPSSDQWVNWPWANGSYTDAQEPPQGQFMTSALAILDLVIGTYPVNTNQVYVTGLSMGGFGTWNAIGSRLTQFAAAMPLSGGGNKDQGALLKEIPTWTYHGTADGVIPVGATDDMRDAVTNAGGSIIYTRINTGHDGWSIFYNTTTYTNAAGETVYEWLCSQTLAPPDLSTVVPSPDTVDADGVSTSTITVMLKDAGNNPLAGKTVTLASSRGATDTLSAASGPSDTNGVVMFSVSSTASGVAEFTAPNTTDSIAVSSTANVTWTSVPAIVGAVMLAEEHPATATAFTTVPNPSGTDYANVGSGNGVTLDIPPGMGLAVGGSNTLSLLLDGLGVNYPGHFSRIFLFEDPGNGRLKLDLQTNLPIGEINTFSTHELNERIAQNYSGPS